MMRWAGEKFFPNSSFDCVAAPLEQQEKRGSDKRTRRPYNENRYHF